MNNYWKFLVCSHYRCELEYTEWFSDNRNLAKAVKKVIKQVAAFNGIPKKDVEIVRVEGIDSDGNVIFRVP